MEASAPPPNKKKNYSFLELANIFIVKTSLCENLKISVTLVTYKIPLIRVGVVKADLTFFILTVYGDDLKGR